MVICIVVGRHEMGVVGVKVDGGGVGFNVKDFEAEGHELSV